MLDAGCLLLSGTGTTCYSKCPVVVSLQVFWASEKEKWGGQRTAVEGGMMLDEGYSVF